MKLAFRTGVNIFV